MEKFNKKEKLEKQKPKESVIKIGRLKSFRLRMNSLPGGVAVVSWAVYGTNFACFLN